MELIATAVVVIVFLGMIALLSLRRTSPVGGFPYHKRATLFTPAERSFLGVLDQAAQPTYRVFGKVRLADVIEVQGVPDRSKRTSALNRISSKHLDFVLCHTDDLSVAGAIELDDRSHQGKTRRHRDQFLERACNAAELPLLRFPARKAYTISEVRSQIHEAFNDQPNLQEASSPKIEPVLGLDDDDCPVFDSGASATEEANVPPQCPNCSAAMERRTIRKGAKAGQFFWGCSTYPACRGILPI